MELRQLRHFLAVVDNRSFLRAAQAVGLTQQAVSHSVALLEDRLQAQLLERGKFGVELTAVGKMFERRARRICAETDYASAEVAAFKGGAMGHIRLGVGQNISTQILPRAVTLFMRARPQIRLTVQVGTSKQLFDSLTAGQCDLAVCSPIIAYDAYTDLEHERLSDGYAHDLHYVVMRPDHPLVQREALTVHDLAKFPWIIPESLTAPWEALFRRIADEGGTMPQQVIRSDSDTFGKALLIQSDCVCIIGIEGCVFELKAGFLRAVPIDVSFELAPALISTRKGADLPSSVAVLIDCLRRAAVVYDDVELAVFG